VTHEYVILTGGRILTGDGRPDCTAIAWAHDTILAVGADDDVWAISRGDSRLVQLDGARVEALNPPATLEAGARANLRVIGADGSALAIIRDGRLSQGSLAGIESSSPSTPGSSSHA